MAVVKPKAQPNIATWTEIRTVILVCNILSHNKAIKCTISLIRFKIIPIPIIGMHHAAITCRTYVVNTIITLLIYLAVIYFYL